jgi:uncharacterized RDD family membrane protein YckC
MIIDRILAFSAFLLLLAFLAPLVWRVPVIDLLIVILFTAALAAYDFFFFERKKNGG